MLPGPSENKEAVGQETGLPHPAGYEGEGAEPTEGDLIPQPAAPPRIRPEVRALAEELCVDCERIEGTGKNGSVTKADVRRAAGGSAAEGEQESDTP